MSRNRVLTVLIAGVLALAAAGCRTRTTTRPVDAPEPPPAVTRYDCLVIRSDGSVILSDGFPKYFSAESAPDEPPLALAAKQSAQLMGTVITIAVYDVDAGKGAAAIAEAMGRIAELSKKLNLFDATSEVSQVNRDAARRAIPVDNDVAAILRRSREVATLTGGAFDVTCGPVTDLWRTYRAKERLPSDEEVERARALVGFDKVTLAECGGAMTVQFAREGMSFDFGGIAKGLASEEAARVLAVRGVRSAIISCGGNVKLIGARPDGMPFRVGIIDPKTAGADERWGIVVPLANAAIDTSGNYRQFTIIGGKRYSHIVDPRTGRSIEAEPSVTVVGPDAETCDALSTAISVLGVEEGLKLIDKVNGESK